MYNPLPTNSISRAFQRETNMYGHENKCIRVFKTALFKISYFWRQFKCPSSRMITPLYSHTMEYYTTKRVELLPCATT